MVIDEKQIIKSTLTLVLFGGLSAGLFYTIKLYKDSENHIKQLETKINAGTTLGDRLTEPALDRLNRHIILPPETPKVIPVKNVEFLKKEQPFFQEASEGDLLVVFSRKVILYNPVLDKVIEVAQIKPGSDPQVSVSAMVSTVSANILE
jgi:hypothetical protein